MKVQMMNRLEEFRRKGLEENRQRMERLMAAQQASMQVAQAQRQQGSAMPNQSQQPAQGQASQRGMPLLSNPG